MNNILILEPSKSVRESLVELMELEGFYVVGVDSSQEGERAAVEAVAKRSSYNLLIVNCACGDLTGALASLPFIVLSNTPSIDEAVTMARRGAIEYLCRPFDMNRLLATVRQALAACEPATESAPPKRRSASRRKITDQIVGESTQIEHLRSLIAKIAPSDARVIILGENGTGKELVAHSIHYNSPRSEAPFVEVNCAAIPSELIESELFGHEKGAFTSAVKQRRGKFEQAQGGTLFLDEIGDMSLAAQAKVLRALQERKITRVGSDRDIDVDVRIIAATNKDIRAEIEAGNFREDLYHRLSVIVLRVAALRDRADDIPILIDHFLHRVCDEYGVDCKEITSEAIEMLSTKSWRGNIRELRNVVERLVILCDERIDTVDVNAYCD